MALLEENFQRPNGRLDPDWLEDMSDVLENLITKAEELTTNERAQEAWIYAKVYRMIAEDAMMRPSTEQSDDIKEVRTLGQIRYWASQADKFQRDYQALIGMGVSGDTQVVPTW